eukprot:TRINITY_DN12286_c0_g1_i15.p1 TRINITY_DN12286_c0_g1~~TRINITY_DN12286_c0_g1_i15.p1  ORF type:complete len:323 (+),score=66.96 TRINITY_DN12286_c0_g1_i15:212-1180(+)
MNFHGSTLNSNPKATYRKGFNAIYFVPNRASSTSYRDLIVKNDFASVTNQATNGLRPDLFAKKEMKLEGRNHRNVSIAGERRAGRSDFKPAEDKKGVIAKKMQLYNTTQFPGKISLGSILSTTNRDAFKLFTKNEASQRGRTKENSKIYVPPTLKHSSIEQRNPPKKSEHLALQCFKKEIIAVEVKEYLAYKDFYSFMLVSKQSFNQSLLLKAQIELIMKGLDKETREKFWREKCRIEKGQAEYEEYCAAPTECEHDIVKDLTRTFMPSHEFCRDPNNYKRLQRILHAFAVKHPEIGYIQGLNFLAGNLIVQFPEDVSFPHT